MVSRIEEHTRELEGLRVQLLAAVGLAQAEPRTPPARQLWALVAEMHARRPGSIPPLPRLTCVHGVATTEPCADCDLVRKGRRIVSPDVTRDALPDPIPKAIDYFEATNDGSGELVLVVRAEPATGDAAGRRFQVKCERENDSGELNWIVHELTERGPVWVTEAPSLPGVGRELAAHLGFTPRDVVAPL